MEKQKIKIAFIAATLNVGGAEKQWYELVKQIDKNQYEIVLICLYDFGEIGNEIKSLGIKCYSDILRNRFSLNRLFDLYKLLKKEKIDCIFLWSQPLVNFYGILSSRFAGIKKIVIAIHNTFILRKKLRTFLVNRIFIRFADKIVALGSNHKDYLIKYEKIPAGKIVIIHNGVDIEKHKLIIDKIQKRKSLGIPLDYKLVGIIARLHPCKRHDIFLEAAKLVLKENAKVGFLIIGEGENREKIKNMIDSLDLRENVFMLGLRSDTREINQILDVSVLSSDPYHETLPMSIIESMASSVPVIATNVGCMGDLIVNGGNGFLIPIRSPVDLANAILAVISDTDLAERMGQDGFSLAIEKFDSKLMTRSYEKLFGESR